MRKTGLLFVLFLFLSLDVFAQLSEGGRPLDIFGLKSVSSQKYIELSLPPESMAKAMKANESEVSLKPFIFAVKIPVNLNANNSGDWYTYDDYNVWQLAIHSEGAKSINLIFDKYHLPKGARLFIFTEDKSDILGAFTSANNSEFNMLATSPVSGDRIIVQYEEPFDAEFSGELSIMSVNHDFIGIKTAGDERRPLGESGSCNVNVNCDYLEEYRMAANSVCRVLIGGNELCSGALINNTENDETPYLYTAGHCIADATDALVSVFLFNYESPYCESIDGSVNHSISGSFLRAHSDSLDFSLVELTDTPPNTFRPFYLGWNNNKGIPHSSVTIHHPLGDIKKISIDEHSPYIKSYNNKKGYINNAFFLIGNWEEGTTEGGSSGAPLIDQDMHFVGSLTGGSATCETPINDYFSRFGIAWDYYSSPSMQLKAWLDPTNSNVTSINGYNPFNDNDLCGAFTNFIDADDYEKLIIDDGKGYWGGSNDYGFDFFAEKFSYGSNCEISGVSMGISEISVSNPARSSKVTVAVYEGETTPQTLIYSQDYNLRDLEEGVMNYFDFDQVVQTTGKFFITYSLENVQPTDTFSVYLAKRIVNPYNTFYIKDGNEWYSYNEKSGTIEGTSALMEVILCNIDSVPTKPNLKDTSNFPIVYPNPLYSGQKLFVEFKEPLQPKSVHIYDLLGRRVDVTYTQPDEKWLNFDFSGRLPGIYFITILGEKFDQEYQLKVSYMGG